MSLRVERLSQDASPLSPVYDAFMVAQEAARHSPLTIKWYAHRLGSFLSFLTEHGITSPELITPNDCRAFIVALEHRGLKANTLHGYAQVVKTFCRFLEREEYASSNAMARVTMPKVPKYIPPSFSPEDIEKLLHACRRLRDRAIVLCLLDTGARAAEFCALRVCDVDMALGTVRIIGGKGGKDRMTYLGATSRQELGRYLRRRSKLASDSPLWASLHLGGLTDKALRTMLTRLGVRSGVQPCTPHMFRRTCALFSLRAGMSVYHVQAILGHEDLDTTRRYLALVEQDTRDAHKRYGPVDQFVGNKHEHARLEGWR